MEEAARLEVLSALQDELRYLLNRWDPIGVYDESLDFPPDEYDCLLGPLLTRIGRHDSRAELSEYLWREAEGHFGLDPDRCGTDGFADRLLAWYAAKNQKFWQQADFRICPRASTCSWCLRCVRKGHTGMAAGLARELAHSTRQRRGQLTWDQCSGSYLKESWSLVR
jgi:hypothetical protein